MARAPSKRVVMNRAVASAIVLGWADGQQEAAEQVLEVARPLVPDRPPIGRGLVASGRAATYIDGKKVAGTGSAPRGAPLKAGVTTVVGYGFPGRFLELGTIHITPRPWLTPAMASTSHRAAAAVAQGIKRRLARHR